jgi:valyl-tRNA synthetase
MEEYGTDAFRFTLAAMAAVGRDIKLAEDRIAGYQNFVNKLWNATRFVLMNLSADDGLPEPSVLEGNASNFADRWIRSRLASTIHEARKALETYRFNDYANVLYQFTWHEFCAWYIEMSKLSLSGKLGEDPKKSQRFLVEVLKQILLLLQPIMPFVTEEIWEVLGKSQRNLMLQPYPQSNAAWLDAATENQMKFLMAVIRGTRNLRMEMNCPPGEDVKVICHGPERDLSFLRNHESYLRSLARVGSVEYLTAGERPKGAVMAVVGSVEIYLPLGNMINLQEQRARLTKEAGKVGEELARIQKKLSNPDFIAKAKDAVVQKEREKSTQYQEKLRTLNLSLERLREMSKKIE